jgi:HK97 family phage major capsid protein
MASVALSALMANKPAGVIGALRGEAPNDPAQIEQALKDVKAAFTVATDKLKQTAETALAQAQETGIATEQVKDTADKLLIAHSALSNTMETLTQKMEELETSNADLAQQVAARQPSGPERPKSIGQQAVESDEYKDFLANGCKGSVRINVNQAITSAGAGVSAGDIIWSDRETDQIVGIPMRRMTIRQLLTQNRTISNLVEYAQMKTRTNNAAFVSEGVQKPESDYVWEQKDAPVRTLAHFVHVTRQAMDDAAMLQGEIDNELRYGLDIVEETALLTGDGVGQNLSGLVTNATAYSAAFTPSSPNMVDTLRLALLQVFLAEYPATGIILHPTDWARIELTKDANKNYLFVNNAGLRGPTLWNQPVVDTQSMTEDDFLVGAFRAAATIYDRMDAEVLASSEDRDNFVKNMITVRAEKRLALAIKRPAALVWGDFGNVSG